VTNIVAAILIWIFLKPVSFRSADEKHFETARSLSPYRDKIYMLFILLTVFFASCFFQIFTNLSAYLFRELHFSKPLIGFLLATNGILIAMVEMVLIYKLEGKRKNLDYIFFGILMIGIAFLMLNIPGMGPVLAFSMMTMITFGEIFSMPFMNSFWISRTRPDNRGAYAAVYSMAWSAAQTLGPLGGSQLAGHLGFKWLWFSVGALCVTVSLLIRKLRKMDTDELK
jgi:predicted MFS family arabinose efflux permease